MPLYEYECEGGHRFEEFHPIKGRHDAVCPCGRPAHLRPSLYSFRMAEPFTVVDGKGRVCHTRQTTDKVPPVGYTSAREV